jgi:AcrR family transcriptional regulator
MGPKGRQTRQRLLDATELLLNTTSLRALRVAEIVRQAETSAPTFYVYFNDVAEAVLALVGELSQSPPGLLALVRQPWNGPQSLDRALEFVGSYIHQYRRHAAAFRARNLASDEGDARFTELRMNATWPLLTALADRVTARQALSDLPEDLQPEAAAGAILAMMERIAVVHIPERRSALTLDEHIDVATFFAAALLGRRIWRRPEARLAETPSETSEVVAVSEAQGPLPAPIDMNLDGRAIGPRGAATRQRIIEATKGLLAAETYLDLKVASIAKAAGVSNATFYLYFQDVSEVILAAIRQIPISTPEFMAFWGDDADESTVEERAHLFVRRYIALWHDNRALFRVRNLAADEGDPRFLEARSESAKPLIALLERRIGECQARGRLPGELDPAAAAAGCLAMVERIAATPSINAHSTVSISTATRAVAFFLLLLLQGLPETAYC